MDDLISQKALLAEYDRVHIGEPGKARKLIADAPTAGIVLCQNCTHHDTEDCPPNRVWCKHLKRRMKPEGYCSYGKPKQNKQQTITEETMNALHKLGEQSHENSRDTSL